MKHLKQTAMTALLSGAVILSSGSVPILAAADGTAESENISVSTVSTAGTDSTANEDGTTQADSAGSEADTQDTASAEESGAASASETAKNAGVTETRQPFTMVFDANGGTFSDGSAQHTISTDTGVIEEGVVTDRHGGEYPDAAVVADQNTQVPVYEASGTEGSLLYVYTDLTYQTPDGVNTVTLTKPDGSVLVDTSGSTDQAEWTGYLSDIPMLNVTSNGTGGDASVYGYLLKWKAVYGASGSSAYMSPEKGLAEFEGWYTDSSLTVPWDGTPARTVYAKWSDADSGAESNTESNAIDGVLRGLLRCLFRTGPDV